MCAPFATREIVLDAAEHLIAPRELTAWLHAPNLDLGGHTPEESLEHGDYDDVVHALWMWDAEDSPVS